MASVRSIIAASPFLFEPSWARVISGEEEGVFGWISANYQLGLLSNTTGVSNVTQGVCHCPYDVTATISLYHP